MIEVPMTEDIRKYQPRVLGPFNLRQIVCMVIAAILAIPLWKLIEMEMDDKIFLIVMVLLPVVACGWVQMDGLPFEKLLFRMIYYYMLTPKKRKYVTENTYKTAYNKRNSKPDQKKKKIKITYSNKNKIYY